LVGAWLTILGAMEVISGFGMRSDIKKVEKMTGTVAAATPSRVTTGQPRRL
jgi:hypothetical protein